MADNNDFAIRVTADVEAAGRNLDQLAEQIEAMSKSGSAHFASLDQSLGGVAAATLMSAAAMTPYGRALTAVVAVMDSAAKAAKAFAEATGKQEEFRGLQNAVGALGRAITGGLGDALGGGTVALAQFAGLADDAATGGTILSSVIDGITQAATSATRQLQAFVESARAPENRSTSAIETQIENALTNIARERALLEQLRNGANPFVIGTTAAETEERIALLQKQLELLQQIRAVRPDASVEDWFDVEAVDKSLEALRRHIQTLQITSATYGMAAAAAAALKVEMEAAAAAGDDWDRRSQKQRDQLASLTMELELQVNIAEARRRGEREAQQGAQRGRQAQRLDLAREGQLDALEREIDAVGRSAGEVAAARFEQQELQKLKQAGLPITAQTVAGIKAEAAQYGQLTEQLKAAQRELKVIEDASAIVGRSLERAFSDWIGGTQTNWKQLVNGMARDIAMLALRAYVLQPLFGGGGASGGGVLGQLLSSIVGLGSGSVEARAAGGPVTGGMPYLVGERGPELFVPGASGQIVPNGAGGGGNTINMRIDVTGALGREEMAQIARTYAAQGAKEAVEAGNAAFPARQRRLRMLEA